jgi:hypothetical protein
MEHSKLIELLRVFDSEALRRFDAFVRSPYFNRNEAAVAMWGYLFSCAPRWDGPALSKARVFAATYPGRPYNYGLLNHTMNHLLKLAERFIAIQGFEEDEAQAAWRQLKALSKLRLDKHFQFVRSRMEVKLDEPQAQGSDYFYYRYAFNELFSDVNAGRGGGEYDECLQRASDFFDCYYFLNKLKFACEMLNRQKIFSVDYALSFDREVADFIVARTHKPVLVDMYAHVYRLLSDQDTEGDFERLLGLLKDHGQCIDREEMRRIYLYAINHSVRNLRKGDPRYITLALDLYLEGIKRGALLENNYITPSTFTNVVKLALMEERFSWIDGFIEKFADSLPPEFQEDALHYNLAEVYYQKKDYPKVLEYLGKLQFSHIQYHLGSRVILLKTYYALDERESLLSLLASFTNYLRRHRKIGLPLKRTYLHFCMMLHKILSGGARRRKQLLEKVEALQPLAERAWLLDILKKTPQASN